MSEQTKGKLEVVKVHGIVIGVGMRISAVSIWSGFKMIANTITDDNTEGDQDEARANAERIVRSWNRDDAFDGLLAACEKAESVTAAIAKRGGMDDHTAGLDWGSVTAARDGLRAAISKATEPVEA